MFEEWDEVKKAYYASAPNMRKVLWSRATDLLCMPTWLTVALTVVVAACAPFAYSLPLGPLVIMISAGLCMIALILSRELLAMKHFQALYQRHRIASQPLLQRETFLRYALFLERLEACKMTSEQALRISDFGKMAFLPKKSLNLSQSLVTVILATLLCGVGVEVLKASSLWAYGHGTLVVTALITLFLIFTFIKLLISDLSHPEVRLARFMEWAYQDLKCTPPRFRHAF